MNILLPLTISPQKNREEIREFRLTGRGKNKEFWPKYLPLLYLVTDVIAMTGKPSKLFSGYLNIRMNLWLTTSALLPVKSEVVLVHKDNAQLE